MRRVDVVLLSSGRLVFSVFSKISQNLSNNIVDDSVTFGGYNFEVKVSWWWPFRERKVIVIGDKGQAIWDDDLKEITVTYGFLEGKYPVKKLEGKSYDDKHC